MTTDLSQPIKKNDKVELPNGKIGTVLSVKGTDIEVELTTPDQLVYERTLPLTHVKKVS